MALPFATAGDLAARLKRPVWTDAAELEQVETLLDDASNDLRAEIGWQVYPPVSITVPAFTDMQGRAHLPGGPEAVTSVVDADGITLAADQYDVREGVLHVRAQGRLLVTYNMGYTQPPAELVKWTCVLAAQAMAQADRGSLGVTPSSETLGGDYRVSYSDRQQAGDLLIPERVLERLRSSYGQTVFVA